jgi:hypothetical protein
MRSIQLFVELIGKRKKSDLLSLTIAVRHTQGTDNKVFRQFLAALED